MKHKNLQQQIPVKVYPKRLFLPDYFCTCASEERQDSSWSGLFVMCWAPSSDALVSSVSILVQSCGQRWSTLLAAGTSDLFSMVSCFPWQCNQIHHGLRSGIVVLGNGKGVIRNNQIFSNKEAGIYILYHGNPIVRYAVLSPRHPAAPGYLVLILCCLICCPNPFLHLKIFLFTTAVQMEAKKRLRSSYPSNAIVFRLPAPFHLALFYFGFSKHC